jgi:hypothetical protein
MKTAIYCNWPYRVTRENSDITHKHLLNQRTVSIQEVTDIAKAAFLSQYSHHDQSYTSLYHHLYAVVRIHP